MISVEGYGCPGLLVIKTDPSPKDHKELGDKYNLRQKLVNKIISVSISPYVQSRIRLSSECGSEDSFIVFDDTSRSICQDSVVYDFSDDDDSDDGLVFDVHYDELPVKKVRFASQENLCEIHPMIQWSYAYQRARKGPWEQYALDRVRFQSRVSRTQSILDPILDPSHRSRIYKERFKEID